MLKPSVKYAVICQGRPTVPSAGLFCNYSPHVCMRTRVDGYEYCIHHILEDKNSPYKQCTYVSSKTNRRCTAAAPRIEKRDGFCPEHARKAVQSRHRMTGKSCRPKTLHTLLDNLSHHSVKPAGNNEVRQKATTKDFASESDSDHEIPTVREIWKTDEESDMESIDSEQEDPLKHAGIYTSEEVASILRDKLIRLQSLYIDQFRYLHHRLRKRRRNYLHGLQQLKGRPPSGYNGFKDATPGERLSCKKLFALGRYQRRFCREALLHRQCKQRRIAFSEGTSHKPPAFPECTSTKDDGTKCTARVLPLSKHCVHHITSDACQVLFKHCNHGNVCRRCVVAFDDASACDLHQQLLPLEYRYSKRPEEPELKDEPVDVVGLTDLQVDLCHDLSSDLTKHSCLKEGSTSLDKDRNGQKPT